MVVCGAGCSSLTEDYAPARAGIHSAEFYDGNSVATLSSNGQDIWYLRLFDESLDASTVIADARPLRPHILTGSSNDLFVWQELDMSDALLDFYYRRMDGSMTNGVEFDILPENSFVKGLIEPQEYLLLDGLIKDGRKYRQQYELWSIRDAKIVDSIDVGKGFGHSPTAVSATFGRDNNRILIAESYFKNRPGSPKGKYFIRYCSVRPFKELGLYPVPAWVRLLSTSSAPNEIIALLHRPLAVMRITAEDNSLEIEFADFPLVLTESTSQFHWANGVLFWSESGSSEVNLAKRIEGKWEFGKHIVPAVNSHWSFNINKDGSRMASWDGANGLTTWSVDFPDVTRLNDVTVQ